MDTIAMIAPLSKSNRGVALVTTVIVVAVLATITVALLQTTGTDRASSRAVANNFQARLAAQAGLAAGMARISESITQGRNGPDQWNYISGQRSVAEPAPNAEASTVAFISQINSQTGEIESTNLLASSPAAGAAAENVEIPIADGEDEPRYPAAWVYTNITDVDGAVIGRYRYAYWVCDDTTKLNPRVHGTGAVRDFSSNPAGIPVFLRDLPTANAASTRLPADMLTPLSSIWTPTPADQPQFRLWNNQTPNRRDSRILSPQTVRLLAAAAVPEQSLENDLSLETLSSPIAPNGRPKVNLTRLKVYLDSLPRTQAQGNRRYQAIIDILNAQATAAHSNWGGGDLSFLLNPAVMDRKYSDLEARQIVANLFDAIDEDFIPTTDNQSSPTILGVEMRYVNGQIQGHPVLVYAGTGHFVGAPVPPAGNSRIRTHLGLGFANPWPSSSERWSQYRVEMNVTPSDPLFPTLTTATAEQLTQSPPAVSAAGGLLPARSGFLFPCGLTFAPHYSASVDRPFNRQVDDLRFTIQQADLFYNSSDGARYLVARLPGTPSLLADPATIPAGGDGVNRTVWQPGRQSYWLRSDFRLPPSAANWVISPNGAGGAASGLIPGPAAPISYMSGPTQGDGAQGLSGRIEGNSASAGQWYRSSSIANHLNLDGSVAFANGVTRIKSTGFLGFISAAKPWQTLTLHGQNQNNPEGQEDWKILDYVYSGDEANTTNANEILFRDMSNGKPYGPGGARATFPGVFARDGSLNVHSPNRNSWRAALEGLVNNPGVVVEELATTGPAGASAYTFDFLREVNLAENEVNDFARERPLRYLADMLTNRSRNFTIYAVGQLLAPQVPDQPLRILATSRYQGRVRIGHNDSDGGISLQLTQSSSF
jgi:hypothetical protein